MEKLQAYYIKTKQLLAARRRRRSRQSRGMKYRLDRWAHLVHVVRWVRENFYSRSGCTLDLVAGFLEKLGRVWVTRGTAFAISWCKEGRQSLLRALSDPESLESRKRLARLGKVYHLPVRRTDLLKVSKIHLRLYLTALIILRGEHLPLNVDLSPIKKVSSVTVETLDRLQEHVSGFWRELRKLSRDARLPGWWQSYHFSTKKGPSRGHAMLESWNNFLALPPALIKSISTLGGPLLARRIGFLLTSKDLFSKFLGSSPSKCLRRLVPLHDKEGKTRVVAILDYWSQTALYPIHSWIFAILRKIPQDMTFNQGEYRDIVLGWDTEGRVTKKFSVDLTQATDRFPISLLSLVLSGMLPADKVSAWKDIMVGYPFSFSGAEDIRYGAGNPMGAYSSWAVFALAHHFVVYVACRRSAVQWSKCKYVLLGDDILIGDSRVARKYLRIIQDLGVEVSPGKTYESYDLCEFAKRLLYRGEEITPFPLSSVSDRPWSIPTVVSSIQGEERKGYVPLHGIPSAVRALQECVYPYIPERRLCEVRDEAFLCELGTKLLSGRISASEYILTVSGDPSLRGEGEWGEAHRVIFTALALQFQRSLGGQGKAKSLWDKWKSGHRKALYQMRQGCKPRVRLDNRGMWHDLCWPEFVDCHPVTHCMMGFNQMVINLENTTDTTTITRETWADLVKGMHNPFSDEAFGLSENVRRARVSHRLGLLMKTLVRRPETYSELLSKYTLRPFSKAGALIGFRAPDGRETSDDWSKEMINPYNRRIGVVFFRLLRLKALWPEEVE
jgi:hypothetical protein